MIPEVLAQHAVVALDTSVLIYHLEGHPDHIAATTSILKAIQKGTCRGIISEISLLELLVLPLRLNLPDVADKYEILLSNFPNLAITAITRDIILSAAALRARYNLKTPDALIIAGAMHNGATLVITNDRQWKRITEIQVMCLADG